MNDREFGEVKSWTNAWGWIRPDSGERDVFCHFTAIDGDGYRQFEPGEKVWFQRALYPTRGPRAARAGRVKGEK